MKTHHIAQINIAQSLDTMDSRTMKSFVDRLDEINALADKSLGFIWRLQTEDGDATSIQAFDDPLLIINMSVWKDIESLKQFVYKSSHIELIKDRDSWFRKMAAAHYILWWIPIGKMPAIEDGKKRLQHLQDHGPSEMAFTFSKPYQLSH